MLLFYVRFVFFVLFENDAIVDCCVKAI